MAWEREPRASCSSRLASAVALDMGSPRVGWATKKSEVQQKIGMGVYKPVATIEIAKGSDFSGNLFHLRNN
jgi:hypothetical protein